MTENEQTARDTLECGSLEDAELVVYTTNAESVNYEPSTEWGQEIGIVSFGLWAQFDEKEIPLWVQNEQGCWISFDTAVYRHGGPEPVSDAFIAAVADVFEGEGEEWGTISEQMFEAMSDVEKLLWYQIREGVIRQMPPVALQILTWCVNENNE